MDYAIVECSHIAKVHSQSETHCWDTALANYCEAKITISVFFDNNTVEKYITPHYKYALKKYF